MFRRAIVLASRKRWLETPIASRPGVGERPSDAVLKKNFPFFGTNSTPRWAKELLINKYQLKTESVNKILHELSLHGLHEEHLDPTVAKDLGTEPYSAQQDEALSKQSGQNS